MRKVELVFERGGRLTATLLSEQAPATCEALWSALPLEGMVYQARFSGEEFFLSTKLDAPSENQVSPGVGDIAFNADPAWRAICVYYGPKMRVAHPYNLFAHIEVDIDLLHTIGERVWRQGGERVTIKAEGNG